MPSVKVAFFTGLAARRTAALALVSTVAVSLSLALGCGSSKPPDLGDQTGPTTTVSGPTPCAPEGATRQCHVEIGENNGVLSCFQGTETCHDGMWSTCGGEGSISAQRFSGSASGGGIRVDSLTTAVNCTNDPCDPSCQTYNETPDAGITPDGGSTVIAITGGSLANSNVPPGFQGKGNDPNGACSSCSPGSTSLACQEACQFDMTCNTNGTNGCQAFGPGQSGACTGIDITVPVTCGSGGNVEVAVCNRGTQSAPPGVLCYVYPGNSPLYPNANPGTGTLVMTTQTTIAPGACETQAIPDSMFPAGGTESLMCNPPNPVTTTTTLGPSTPGVTVSQGSWLNTDNTFAADSVDSTLPLTASTQANTFSSTSQNSTWSNTGNAMGTAADGAYATAAVTAASSATTVTKLPTSSTVQSGTWSNASNAYSSTDSGASVTTTVSLPTTNLPSSGGLGATTTTGDSCNGSASAACIWKSGSSSDASSAEGAADGAFATATLTRGDDAVAFLGGYAFTGVNAVPSNAIVTQVTATVTWKQSFASNRYTGGIAIYAGNGASLVGSECTSNGLATTASTMACTVTAAQLQTAGFAISDLTSANLVRIHGNHSNAGSSTSYAIEVDSVAVQVQYQVPTTASILLSGFGLNVANSIPSTATINSLSVTASLKGSASNSFATVSFQAYKNAYGTAIGIAPTTISNPATSLTQYTNNPSVIGLTPADLTDANFGVLVSASAATADWTLSVDYIQVSVNYSLNSGSNQTVTLNGFGFDSTVPVGASIESVTTEVRWKTDVSSSFETLGIQAYANGTPLGSELTTPASGPPTTATTVSYAVTSGVTASQLYDANNFRVKLRATSTGGSNFNAYVDYVKVTVVWSATLSSTMTLGHFGFNIPSTATITGLTLETKWSVSASNTTAQLGIEAFTGTTAIGTLATTPSGSSPPTTDTVFTTSPSVAGLTYADFTNGTFTVSVTGSRGSGSTGTTARVDYVRVTVTYTTTTDTQIPECNYNNDWSVSKQNPALACQNVTTGGYTAQAYTQTYTASCPSGTHPQWAYLAYDATTPSNASGSSDVKFQIQTAPLLVDGGVGTPTAWVSAADTPGAGDPALCPMSGPSPCPKNLYTALGGPPGATNEDLTLQVTLTPSPDGQVAPTLNSWQITYSCPPSE
jgi:hypothetical protein